MLFRSVSQSRYGGARLDEDGYIWITGRVDDVINVSGHRLGTAEIEAAVAKCDKVAEVAVVGKPDIQKYRPACKGCKRVKSREQIKAEATADAKSCNFCGEIKDAKDFKKGHRRCKVCEKQYKAAYYQANKERLLNKFKGYYKENSDLFDSEDLTVCSKMISFFKDKSGVREGHNLKKYYAGIARHLLCVAQIRLDYFVYTVDENNIIQMGHLQIQSPPSS